MPFIIYGCGTKAVPADELNKEIGDSARCPRSDCQGIMHGLAKEKYCSICFVPICCFGKEEYVKCKACGSAYSADSYKEALKKHNQDATHSSTE